MARGIAAAPSPGGGARKQLSGFSSTDRIDVYSSCDAAGDVFYGTDDIDAMRDVLYKEDVIESYRREAEMKSLRKRRQAQISESLRCFDFLKILFCCLCFWK